MSSALPTQINRSDGAASAAPGPVRKLTKRQKAAIVVRLLMAEGADLSLAGMSETTLADLTLQMTTLRYIDRATLEHVIEEFLAEIDAIGLSFPGGVEDALSILESAIDADTATRLRKQAGVSEAGDPWERHRRARRRGPVAGDGRGKRRGLRGAVVETQGLEGRRTARVACPANAPAASPMRFR